MAIRSTAHAQCAACLMACPSRASSATAWRKVTEILSPQFECLAVNPSGYAETESFRSDRPMSLDDEADSAISANLGELVDTNSDQL